MASIIFNCTLLTDLVLTSNAASDGFHKSLDYIPGAKFLGIVARKYYQTEKEDECLRSLDFFHNGKVRFSDAHPLVNGQRTFRIPLSWHAPKKGGLKEGVYLSHNLSKTTLEKLVDDNIQLKQQRGLYFTSDHHFFSVDQNFSIKSAYNSETLRSKDGQMYGYFALKKGSEWQFRVDFDEPTYETKIKTALIGKKRMGRSASAQYGQIDIKEADTPMYSPANQTSKNGRILIYADSNLCFYDERGNNTLQPDPIDDLGMPAKSSILWDESQIRSRVYRTWNKKRNVRNADRSIIEKGSVFVVSVPENEQPDLEKISLGIGAHRSEGFGQVFVNPDFLPLEGEKLGWSLTKLPNDLPTGSVPEPLAEKELSGTDKAIFNFLQRKQTRQDREDQMGNAVNAWLRDSNTLGIFADMPPSQWGQIRNIARNTTKEADLFQLLFDPESGFLNTGQSKNAWNARRTKKLDDFFKKVQAGKKLDAMIMLASEMAKYASNQLQK